MFKKWKKVKNVYTPSVGHPNPFRFHGIRNVPYSWEYMTSTRWMIEQSPITTLHVLLDDVWIIILLRVWSPTAFSADQSLGLMDCKSSLETLGRIVVMWGIQISKSYAVQISCSWTITADHFPQKKNIFVIVPENQVSLCQTREETG